MKRTRPLGQFIDRYTMRYERVYEHPIELVWEAVTTPEQMDQWMLPRNFVEPRAGGRFGMSFGQLDGEFMEGTVEVFDPPRTMDYAFDNGSRMRFELETVEYGTRLVFVHSFPTSWRDPARATMGGDLPGGPDTPWRPGFMAGFHLQLDNLVELLASGAVTGVDNEPWPDLIREYRNHTLANIPGGAPVEEDAYIGAALEGDRAALEAVEAGDAGAADRARAARPELALEAAERAHWDVVTVLAKRGFAVNPRPGASPLHYAVGDGQFEVVRLLVELGADLSAQDERWNATPLGWAQFQRHTEIAAYLESVSQSNANPISPTQIT